MDRWDTSIHFLYQSQKEADFRKEESLLLLFFAAAYAAERSFSMLLIVKFLGGMLLALIGFKAVQSICMKVVERKGYYDADIAELQPKKRLLIAGGLIAALLL